MALITHAYLTSRLKKVYNYILILLWVFNVSYWMKIFMVIVVSLIM